MRRSQRQVPPMLARQARCCVRIYAGSTTLTKAFTGRLARSLTNRKTREMNHGDSPIAPYPVQAWFMGSLAKLAVGQGREDFGSLSAGQSVALIRHDNARELMDELVRETPNVLCRVCLRE